jgi:protein-S-isoprenylcysteine O-methyltransferase Ste14
MSTHTDGHSATKRTFWAVAILYVLIAFEFFYMASPFAIYFYSVYGPGLSFINNTPALAWLSSVFLPHIVVETSSVLLNYKLARKGAVTGGIYNFIRHPQYVSLAICSFGLLWSAAAVASLHRALVIHCNAICLLLPCGHRGA